jgi:ribosomal-protein-alanine N-acetyltransferase
MQLTFACNCESPVLSGRPVIRPAYPCVRVSEVSSPHFPALSTERLTLRVIAPHDVAEFRALMSVPEVTRYRYSNWPEAPTYDQANEWTRNLAELFPSGKGCAWVIAERSSGGFSSAPFTSITPIWEWRVGGIGYEAHPDYWGRGLTTEALRAVVTYGHRAFALNRIEAWTLPGNDASDRVLEKAGFRFEGIFREKGFFKGAFHDFRMFGRVAADAVMDAPIGDDRPVAAE